MAHKFTVSYIEDSRTLLRQHKRLAEKAMNQVTDLEFSATLDAESNSIAVLVQHLAGNMRSRWTDFLISDGEKPDRNRDAEFEARPVSRAELMALWEDGWRRLFAALDGLTDESLPVAVMIRGEPHSVMQAINRQVAHYSLHIGQIIFLAKHYRSAEWKTLSVPRGKSE